MHNFTIQKIMKISLLIIVSLFYGQMSWADWDYNYDTAWLEDFENGVPGAQPENWSIESHIGFVYSYQDSYVAITRPTTVQNWGEAYSENIYCNVDIYDTLEIRIADSSCTNRIEWSIGLQENTGDKRYFSFYTFTGATGTFSFRIRDITNWTGNQNFRVRVLMKSDDINEAILIDYISVFRNPTDKQSLWREDFIGFPGNTITSWWSEEEDSTVNGEIYYSDSFFASCGNVRLVDIGGNTEAPWGKVLSPSIYWDRDEYNYLEFQITNVAPGTAWKVIVRDPVGAQEDFVELIHKTNGETGVFNFDVQDISGWLWSESILLSLELVVEGTIIDDSYDIDYIQVYRPQDTPTPVLITPSPTPTASPTVGIYPQGGFVTPNPFLPKRGDKAFFNFQMPVGDPNYRIRIMDLHGRIEKTLANVNEWDGRNNQGLWCEAGIYIYQIEGLNHRVSGKLVIIH